MKKLQKIMSYTLALMMMCSAGQVTFAQESKPGIESNTRANESPITRTANRISVTERGILNTTTNLVVAEATMTPNEFSFEVVNPEGRTNPIELGTLTLWMGYGENEETTTVEEMRLAELEWTARLLESGNIQITVTFETPVELTDLVMMGINNITAEQAQANEIDWTSLIGVQIYTVENENLQSLMAANFTGVENAGVMFGGTSQQNRREAFESDVDFVNDEVFSRNLTDSMRNSIREINKSVTVGSTTMTILSALSTVTLPLEENVGVQTMFTFSIQDDNITWNAERPWANSVKLGVENSNYPEIAQGVFVNTDTNTAYFNASLWHVEETLTAAASDVLVNIQIQDLASNRMDETTPIEINFYEILKGHNPTMGSRFENRENRGGSSWGSPDIEQLMAELELSSSDGFTQFFTELKEDELNIPLAESVYLSNLALVDNFLTVQVRYENQVVNTFRDVYGTEKRVNFWTQFDPSGDGPRMMQLMGTMFEDYDAVDRENAPRYEDTLFFVEDVNMLNDLQTMLSTSAFEMIMPVNIFADFTAPVVPRSIYFEGEDFSYPLELDGMALEMTSLFLDPQGIQFTVTPSEELTNNTNFNTDGFGRTEMNAFFNVILLDEAGNALPFTLHSIDFSDNEWRTGFGFNALPMSIEFMDVASVMINNTIINVANLR